jgi:hypothetical protein
VRKRDFSVFSNSNCAQFTRAETKTASLAFVQRPARGPRACFAAFGLVMSHVTQTRKEKLTLFARREPQIEAVPPSRKEEEPPAARIVPYRYPRSRWSAPSAQ